jgi:hypothetical protein
MEVYNYRGDNEIESGNAFSCKSNSHQFPRLAFSATTLIFASNEFSR